MKNKGLIIIVVILSIILLAGIATCVILSAPKEEPMQEQPGAPTAMETQATVAQEQFDVPVNVEESQSASVVEEVEQVVATEETPEEPENIPEETEKTPEELIPTKPPVETEATRPKEEIEPTEQPTAEPTEEREILGPNELPGF